MPRCSQVNCRIAETGICLDGHANNCPHLLADDLASDSQKETAVPVQMETPEPQRFHTGEKFTVSEASRLLNDRPTHMVFCVGSQWSGKTTFLARIGEMFRDGSFSDYRFAGSLTLCAFERASWLATITSGVERPDTRRTERRENDTFFHLQVQRKNGAEQTHETLISDLAGETFSTAVASREFCSNLRSLARADHLVLFLDCARLVHQAQRHSEVDNAREFLQQVCAVKHKPASLSVQVVFSRWDYVSSNPQAAAVEKFCLNIESDFGKRFASSFIGITFQRIAARPSNGTEPTNAEIQKIFASWLEPPHVNTPTLADRKQQTVRDFCAFGLT